MAIVFPIVTSYNDKGTKKADDAFTKLGKKFLAVFSVTKVVQFGKASVQAFSDSTKEAQLLATQLNAVNLGFASPMINDFIDKLELATGVAGNKLTNAFISLSQATGDVSTAQKILSTALDVSLGTGKDLNTITNALQRAYKGETTALAKLRIGYTTTELKGRKFEDVIKDLQERFDGAAGKATDTFAGKMARLSAAVEQAKEAFGEGLVGGLEDADIAIEDLQEGIISLGKALGDTAAAFVEFGKDAKDTFQDIVDSAPFKALGALFEGFTRFVIGGIVMGDPGESFASATARIQAQERRREEERNRARLRTLTALTKAESKSASQRIAAEKKVTAEKKKQAAEAGIINEINKRFELDRIQIAAALGGQINDVERLRLELMQAILDEDVKRAIILEGQLIKAEAAAKELSILLDSLDTMVGDPFADWPGTINRIKQLLSELKIKIPIETLFAEKGLRLDQDTMTVTKLENMSVNANTVTLAGPVNIIGGNTGSTALSGDILDEFRRGLYHATNAVNAHAAAVGALADAELMLADSLLGPGNVSTDGTDINITVMGTVVTEDDLIQSIIDGLLAAQRNGQGIFLTPLQL